MSPWALFAYAQDHPARSRGRRIAWGVAVLTFCGVMLPLAVVGVAQQWAAGEVVGGVIFAVLAVLMAGGVVAAIVGFTQNARAQHSDSHEKAR